MKKFSTAPHKEPDLTKKWRKEEIWCPYCGDWRRFKQTDWGYYRCQQCTISTNDFWVRKANGLWESTKPKDAKVLKQGGGRK